MCVGVRWCAWDDAEALEGAAGSGLERLVRTTARTTPGHVGHSVPNLASSYVVTSLPCYSTVRDYIIFLGNISLTMSLHDPAFLLSAFWDIDVVRSVRTKGGNIF